jgi:hypothetical protein
MSPRLLAVLGGHLDLDCLVYDQVHELVETLYGMLAAELFTKAIARMPYPDLALYSDPELLKEPYGDW